MNRTAAASSNGVEIGADSKKSTGDTLWLTNAKDSNNFTTVLDMILSAYPDKVSNVNWILPDDGTSQNSIPVAYLVTVKEGSTSVNIKVTSENNPNTSVSKVHISKGEDNSGIHKHFCKALVKAYGSPSGELKKDTNNNLDDYDALFNDDKYKIQTCNQAMVEAGIIEGETGGKENESGYIGDWNVGLFVQRLHYWQKNVCEVLDIAREKKRTYRGCHRCTAAINRALSDSGLGRRYWGGDPWNVYDNMKSNGSRFHEITGGTSSSKYEFNFGQSVQKGDICVMWQIGRKEPRHTCAYDGSRWYSDVVQNMCNVYTGSGEFKIEWHLFRYG